MNFVNKRVLITGGTKGIGKAAAIAFAKLGAKIGLLNDLQQCLTLFYDKYNNQRLHSATLYLPPMVFWDCWEKGLVKLKVEEKKRKIKFSLLVPYQQLLGDLSLRSPLRHSKPQNGVEFNKINKTLKEMSGAETFQQLSVENRPRLSFAFANVNEK